MQQLRQTSAAVEVRDANGELLGTFAPPYGKLPPGRHSPVSDAELDRRRQEPDGRSLAEILRDLGERR